MNALPPTDDYDEQIRVMLEDAVADVEPRAGLDEIRACTTLTRRRSRRAWMFGAGATVLGTAAAVAAVAVLSGSPTTDRAGTGLAAGRPTAHHPTAQLAPQPAHPSGSASPQHSEQPTGQPAPSHTATSAPSASAPALTSGAVPVYYIGDTSRGPRLYREFHTGHGRPLLQQALTDAVTASASDPDYRSPWPAGTTATGRLRNGVLIVDLRNAAGTDLHGPVPGTTPATASLALQQLVYTADAATQTTAPVRFLLDGSRTNTVLGRPASTPIARASAEKTLAQVWVTAPTNGQRVTSPFRVTGVGSAFEATLQWELMRGTTVVRHGVTTAQQCCTMAPYSFSVHAPPGAYTLVVHDTDASGGEGFAPWQDTKAVTVIR